MMTSDGAEQLELPLEFPTPETVLPPDAPTNLTNTNAFMKAVVLFPNYFGVDLYEAALQWQTLTPNERKVKLAEARGIATSTQ